MPESLVLTGATLIDGTGAAPVSGRAVVVRDGRIQAVSRSASARGQTRPRRPTLLPGLINCHVHLCFGGEADPGTAMVKEAFAATVIKAAMRARQTVEAGVTTVRDLGGRDYAELSVRDAVRSGTIPGPRVLCAGKGICITGGHGWQLIGREADGPDEVRKAVREQLRAGADVIKIFATGA
jgi:imidazolonepropionase-like amidohydrolase